MKYPALFLTTCLAWTACTDDSATTDADLRATLRARFAGDRTGACVAAAFLDAGRVARATFCADGSGRLGPAVALEIGSVTKTMTAALLASEIEKGRLRLDDPLAAHLPSDAVVPQYQGQPIRLAHLVTHTSGLPSIPADLPVGPLENPYAALTEEELLRSLAHASLERAPGARWEYSNFAFMLLSSVVARSAGQDLEALLKSRLFTPLGMSTAYIAQRPAGVTVAQGHLSSGLAVPAWDFPVNLAGVGGVRATLDDMIRYAAAHLGRGDASTVATLRSTHTPVELGVPRAPSDPVMAMGWPRLELGERTVLVHDGGTGGFSSLVLLDVEHEQAVVLLADTMLANTGGLVEVAAYLFDRGQMLPGPRLAAEPSAALLASLAGRYRVDALEIELVVRGGRLVATLPDGSELLMRYDSRGDFYPETLEGLLTPMTLPDGSQSFAWWQDGVPVQAERLSASARVGAGYTGATP